MDIALFSPSSLFHQQDDSSDEQTQDDHDDKSSSYVQRSHQFPGMELVIREFSFHQMNANLLWPGTFAFVDWLVQQRLKLQGRRIIELGSGTGALAIFLNKLYQVDVTTSDYDDQEIEDNIAHNCTINGVSPVLPHIKHSWGDPFPIPRPKWDLIIASDILLYSWGDPFPIPCPKWDLIIASDILLYVKQYPNLIKTLCFLLKCYKPRETCADCDSSEEELLVPRPAFLMSWRRRIGKEDESLFFSGCETAGLQVKHLGSRVYCITP